jgi:hypothetical protein
LESVIVERRNFSAIKKEGKIKSVLDVFVTNITSEKEKLFSTYKGCLVAKYSGDLISSKLLG